MHQLREQIWAMENIVKTFGPRASENHLALPLKIDAGVPDILRGDSLRLRQIVVNLVGNALEFTAAGGVSIRVAGQRCEATVELHFAVRDTGIGLDSERQRRIFEAFSQAEAATSCRVASDTTGDLVQVGGKGVL